MIEAVHSPVVDKEQNFLLSRQARTNASSNRSQKLRQHSEELHAFWTVLRRKLSKWEACLDQLEKNQPPGIVRQKLEDLKEELQKIKKHCLAPTVCFDDWEVPELAVADLRLLHTEFTKYSSKWETAKCGLVPKGKFAFQRYREELARRKANGVSLDAPSSRLPAFSSKEQLSPSLTISNGSCVENFADVSISIDINGDVQLQGAEKTDRVLQVSSSALLIRNLNGCSITIKKPLQALHVVQSSKTTIRVTEPVSSSIHVTDCHDCSFHAKSQQLRLHESTNLNCYVDLVAGAILEDCSGLLFVSNNIDVKDFNWLRTGIPSPNFRIETPQAEIATKQCETSEKLLTASFSDEPALRLIKEDPVQVESKTVEEIHASVSNRDDNDIVEDEEDEL